MGPPADHDLDERPHGVIRVLTLGHSVEKKLKLKSWVGGWGWGLGFVDRMFVSFYRLTFMYSHKCSPICIKCVIIFPYNV